MDYEDKESIICFIIMTITFIAFVMSGEIVLIFCTAALSPLYLFYLISNLIIILEYLKFKKVLSKFYKQHPIKNSSLIINASSWGVFSYFSLFVKCSHFSRLFTLLKAISKSFIFKVYIYTLLKKTLKFYFLKRVYREKKCSSVNKPHFPE